jgi:hypothetical protein
MKIRGNVRRTLTGSRQTNSSRKALYDNIITLCYLYSHHHGVAYPIHYLHLYTLLILSSNNISVYQTHHAVTSRSPSLSNDPPKFVYRTHLVVIVLSSLDLSPYEHRCIPSWVALAWVSTQNYSNMIWPWPRCSIEARSVEKPYMAHNIAKEVTRATDASPFLYYQVNCEGKSITLMHLLAIL